MLTPEEKTITIMNISRQIASELPEGYISAEIGVPSANYCTGNNIATIPEMGMDAMPNVGFGSFDIGHDLACVSIHLHCIPIHVALKIARLINDEYVKMRKV